MIFRFLILSDEVENFKREIKTDSDATFFDLYEAIIDSTGFSREEMASFFICDDKWRKQQEITLIEMDTDSDEDPHIMEETVLSDLLEDEKQKLMFVFDYVAERALYIVLSEMIPGKSLAKPVCSLSEGEAPNQTLQTDELKSENTAVETGESFFGDEEFDMDELDKEGFEGLDEPLPESGEADLF